MGALGAAPGVLSVLMTNSNILFVKFCLMKLSCPLMALCLGDHWFCHLTVDVGVELPVLWLMQTRQSNCSDRSDTHLVSQSRWECGHSKWAHHGFSSLDTIRLSLRLFFFFCPSRHSLFIFYSWFLFLLIVWWILFWAKFISRQDHCTPKDKPSQCNPSF